MTVRLVREGGELLPALREYDADPAVEGIAVFATDGSLPSDEDLGPALRDCSVPVFGGLFPEVFHEGDRLTEGIVVVGLATAPDVTVVSGLSDPETAFEDELPERVPDDGTAFVFVDAFADRIEDFVAALFAAHGTQLGYLGGGAGSLEMEQQPCLLTTEGVVEDAAVLAVVDTPTSVGVKHGWEAIAGPLRVTAADGQRLVELDGEPAFSVYREIVEADADVTLTEENFFDVAKMYPFGISRLEGEKIVRDPFEVDDGALTCFGDVPEGEFVHVLRGEPATLVDAAGEAYETAVSRAAADGDVLFFDCISRVLYLEDEFDRELDAVGDEPSPAFGALTIGEIANDGAGHLDFYNKTAVTAVADDLTAS